MKNLDHPERELLIRLALGEMTELDAKPILTHLASCDSCRSEFLGCCDDLEKLRGDDPVLAEDLNLGAERRLALMAKFRGSKVALEPIQFPRIPGSLLSWFVAAAAAALLGAMLLPSLGSSRKNNVVSAIAYVAPESPDYAPVPPPPPPPPLESIEDNPPISPPEITAVTADAAFAAIDDNTPSTNDAAMVNLVSDVKAVVSPTTSSKMYSGRRATGRTGATAVGKGHAEASKKAATAGGEFPEDEGGFSYQKDASKNDSQESAKESRKNVIKGEGHVEEEKTMEETLKSGELKKFNVELGHLAKTREKNEKLQAEVKALDGDAAKADKQLDQAKVLYADRQFDKAKEAAERVLVEDPYNKEAAEVLARTNGRLSETGRLRREIAVDERVAEMEWKWSMPAVIGGKTLNRHLDSGIRSLANRDSKKGLAFEGRSLESTTIDKNPVQLGADIPFKEGEQIVASSPQMIIPKPDPLLLKQNAATDQLLAESAKRSQGRDEAQAAAQEETQSKAQDQAEPAKPSEDAEAAKDAATAKPAAERSEVVRQDPTPAEELARRDKEREAAKQRALCFKDASKDPLSTFAMDVDTASYQRVKEMIQRGQAVSPEAVRTEEFVNAFNYNYATPEASTFAIHAEHAPSNLGQGRKILRVAVQAARPGADSRRPSRLTILVDTSGSMARENRLPLLRKVLPEMLKQMRPSDSLTLIACDSSPRLLADRIPAGDTERLERAFAELKPSGATNLEAGLGAAYKSAQDHFDPAGMNRLVLISDGVANLGNTEAEGILGRAVEARRLGVSATVIGMGRGEYNDRFLETLADKGNGFYAYVDNAESAQRVFVDNFAANFASIAKDAKIQMEFDPAIVRSWRLLGYENRLLAATEFRDDKVGGGEVGPGQSVTAVYELDCVPGLAPEARLGVMHIRYQDPSGRLARESERAVYGRDGAASFDSASFSLRLAAVAAQFAEQLKGYNRDHELTLKALHQLALEQPGNPALGELIQLMEKVGGEDIKL